MSYRLVDCGTCVTTNPTPVSVPGVENPVDPKQHLTIKLKKLLQDVEVQSKYVILMFIGPCIFVVVED